MNWKTHASTGFTAFALAAQKPKKEEQLVEIQAAAKGVMGMMRFGHHDSAILLEALGDLLFSLATRIPNQAGDPNASDRSRDSIRGDCLHYRLCHSKG